jgi:hypothetical protein
METAVSRDELEAIVREARRVKAEHGRAGRESTARRQLQRRLAELEGQLERLLGEWVADAEVRRAWRRHLRGDGPEPPLPLPLARIVFRGRSDAGSVVVVTEAAAGLLDVEVDGTLVERIAAGREFGNGRAPHVFVVGSVSFREEFASSRAAVAALRAFAEGGAPPPPWRHAAELAADGLVDRHFALTARGRRALVSA